MKFFAAIVCLFALYSGLSKAQDLSECQAAANLAYKLTLGVTEGFPLDNQQVNFPLAPTEAQEGNQRWAQMIKEKVKPLLPQILPQPHTPEADQLAQNIGRALAEECAFALGALRKIGSVQPPTANEVLRSIAPDLAASSQAVASETERVSRCNEILEDEDYIFRLHGAGATFGHMRQRAINSAPYLGQERLDKIMALIQEAQDSGDVRAWHQRKRQECEG